MSVEPKHVPFDEFIRDAPALFDDMERDGQPVVVERAGKLFTLRPPRTRRRKKTGVILPDDPMWGLVGLFSTEPNNDVADNKHRYIADAIASHGIPDHSQRNANDAGPPASPKDTASEPPSIGSL